MTNKQEWFSLVQASKELNRGNTYVSVWLRRHPDELPNEMIMETGRVKLISKDGIKWIKQHTKKEDVLVSSNSANEDQYLKKTVLGDILSIIHFKGRARGSLD
ncbi:MAG: hypothetical protein ABF991_09980 [Liquorilactobacillus hordei]|uniref:Uncharacterized protein n=1 Tax=Liquorilactobacillus hordei TaxID=468911 RepID=A0A3S6QSH3_9LACO|nr:MULTISPECIES: hypothetical protein [Liquorilactobacillus]AUJ31013.1 hypothetical protein BSQ49_12255 [Liquorilactobacillus hordei]MCC7667545.1 hypothetical protein [Liquorilactobacillus satsumensis]